MTRIEHRLFGLIWMLGAVALGLGSRNPPIDSWPVVGNYGGDAAWTMAACGGIRMCLPRLSIRGTAMLGYAVSVMVECSQLFHPAWLDDIRAHRLGALLLGRGFLWSDLVAYAAGAVVFLAVLGLFERHPSRRGIAGSGTKGAEIGGRKPPPSG